MIPLKVHNVIDYVAGIALVMAPYLFGFYDVTAARNVFLVLGLGLIGYSLFTNYYYSVAKAIPLKVHMAMDVTSGITLMLSPWVFGYANRITGGDLTLHFVLGLAVIGLVAFTDMRTPRRVGITNTNGQTSDLKRVA